MAGPWRPAHYGLGTAEVPVWISQLAEELASLCQAGADPGTVSQRIREEARAHSWEPWPLANMVAREWDRLGIARVPARFMAGGW